MPNENITNDVNTFISLFCKYDKSIVVNKVEINNNHFEDYFVIWFDCDDDTDTAGAKYESFAEFNELENKTNSINQSYYIPHDSTNCLLITFNK